MTVMAIRIPGRLKPASLKNPRIKLRNRLNGGFTSSCHKFISCQIIQFIGFKF